MRSTIITAAAIARIAMAAPAPQQFDIAAVLNAPSPSVVGPPTTAVASITTAFSVNTASLASSVSAEVTTAASASVTGADASAAATQQSVSVIQKRKQKTSSTATTTQQQSSTLTSSSSSACPTQPEAGTYCGFINPEDPCAPQPQAYGPHVDPDTPEAFEADPEFHAEAFSAVTPFPYERVFVDLNASVSANSYLTYHVLKNYDVQGCANYCDNTDLCTAFNVFVERDPSLNPTKNGPADNSTGQYCPNPPSVTNYKCSLWGSSISRASATNYGQYREDFHVVIAGSNGYDKTNLTTPTAPSGWTNPSNCTGGAISGGGSYWLGSSFFPGAYDPRVCGDYAQAQAAWNKQAAQQSGAKSYTPVNYFNAYTIHKSGVAQGTYCTIYDTVLSPAFGKTGFRGSWSGKDYFGVGQSWAFSSSSQDSGSL